MANIYPLYPNRKIHQLDGVWSMKWLGDIDPNDLDVTAIDYDRHMAIPGVWDTQPELAGQRGLVAITTQVHITPNTRSQLRCGGLGLWGQLWVDGTCISDHHLPYAAWTVDIPASALSQRTVTILIDNRFGPERGLMFDDYFDWYAHGGIYRSVFIHELTAVSFERAHVRTLDTESGDVEVSIYLNASTDVSNINLTASWDDGPDEDLTLAVINGAAQWKTQVPQHRLWSPETPHLHLLKLNMPDSGDSIVERVGLRTITHDKDTLLLNNQPLKLQGVNRHEAQVVTGPVLSTAEKFHDILLLKDLGCNFVRGSHYQQDQEFLDLCDEHGLLIWEEGTGWQAREQHFVNPRFAELQEKSLRIMTHTSFNHPSVIIWGFLNEGESFREESKPVYERLTNCLRDANDGRLISYACNHPFNCLNLDLVDLISINAYPGWYPDWNDRETATNPHPFALIKTKMNEVLDYLNQAGHADKPKIISEIGAGAIYGWRDQFAARWSEQFQSDYLQHLCDYLRETPGWQGLAIWHFSDARTYQDGHALGRPRSFNNKGLLDEYRRPKQAYQTVKAAFHQGIIAN